MKSLWRIAVPVGCVVLICGAALTWHFVEARTTKRKLVEDAMSSRVRAEQGDAKAQSDLGHMYFHGEGVQQDYAEALRWYSKAADQGYAKAQYAMGYMHYYGQGVPQNYAEAIPWFRKSAGQGYAMAQESLGLMYSQGKGVPQDYPVAVGWYRKAADQGYAEAQYHLAGMYYSGKGVPQDYGEALNWFRRAADQGHAKAQYDLGYMYYDGRGVPQDHAEAAHWFRKAAKQGDEYAQRALDSMKIRLTAQSKITLSILFLGGMLLLIHSRGRLENQRQRRTALTSLLVLSGVGLDVYGYSHFGVLQALSAVNAFYFGKNLLSGICVAMLVSLVWPQVTKALLGMCAVLFLGLDLYAITHYGLRLLAPRIREFYSANGWLLGLAIPLAIFLWMEARKNIGGQNGNDGVAPVAVGGS